MQKKREREREGESRRGSGRENVGKLARNDDRMKTKFSEEKKQRAADRYIVTVYMRHLFPLSRRQTDRHTVVPSINNKPARPAQTVQS